MLLLLLLFGGVVQGVEIDNGIIGQPDVICRDNGVTMLVNTRRPFTGHIYVKVSTQINARQSFVTFFASLITYLFYIQAVHKLF